MPKEKGNGKSSAQKKAEQRAAELLSKPEHSAVRDEKLTKRAMEFCEGYKRYLDEGKTERLAASAAAALLEKGGYVPYEAGKPYEAGSKVYLLHRNKAVIAATVGKKSLQEGARLTIAHIDSPRLDLKPNPLYEAEAFSYFKTHYYGGVRKYQWAAIPLSMHGVVVDKEGKSIEISIGEKPGEPVFTVTDLLPHLSREQDKRTLAEGIKGEELNILLGSLPFGGSEVKEQVKLYTMHLLNQYYGITEQDFMRAEIELVPAFKACDVGLDKSMVGAYGQDDRVCAYTALMAEIDTKSPLYTSVCVLSDKEEVGSDGNTGLVDGFFFHFLQDMCEGQKVSYRRMLAASWCLSADVNAAYDPSFPDVYEKRNSAKVNHGVVITKYVGARGKSGTSDASAEYLGSITNLFSGAGVPWQTGELGKVDAGGGGTIAMLVANHNVDVVDVGVPVLSMHSPFEVTGKLDVYSMYCAFAAFIGQK